MMGRKYRYKCTDKTYLCVLCNEEFRDYYIAEINLLTDKVIKRYEKTKNFDTIEDAQAALDRIAEERGFEAF